MTDREKRAAYAQAYGAGDITVGRMVGRYPPLDYIAERMAYTGSRGPLSPPSRPDDRRRKSRMFNFESLLKEVEDLPSIEEGLSKILTTIEQDTAALMPIISGVGSVATALVANTESSVKDDVASVAKSV